MKKIIISVLAASSLVMAADEAQIKQEIADVQAQMKKLNENLKTLQAQLPKKVLIKKDSEFITHTELGYITTSGNTQTDTFNIDTKIKKNWDLHAFTLSFLMQYATENDIESKNKFLTELEYDYAFTDRVSFGYLVGYKDDKFSGFDYQLYTGPSAKYKVIKTDAHKLSVEGNILYSVDSIQDSYKDGSGNIVNYPFPAGSINQNDGHTDSYASYRFKGTYNWQMLENLKFEQTLSYRSEFADTQNYFVYSKTALSSKLSDIFSAGISYQADYTNKSALGKTGTDKIVTINLIADY
jgi:putative salt-induced outer membrane protein